MNDTFKLVIIVLIASMIGGFVVSLVGKQSGVGGGTRFPSGLSADSTSPSSGEVRGTTLTSTGAATLNSAVITNGATVGTTLVVTGATTLTGAATFAVAPTVTAGDLILTDGRLDLAISASANDCASNAVTLDLSSASSTQGIIQSDQLSGACAITFTNGVAGELVILDLTYGGDTAWTFVAGGAYLFDTWAEADCDGFEATAVDSDHLIVTGIMTDASSMMILSCIYIDQ